MKFFGVLLSVYLAFSAPMSMAQTPEEVAEQAPASGPKRQLATIVYAGLGGAVLGLSTLSFYGRPQDRLNNVNIGLALGIIAGTVYTTYRAATDPLKTYEYEGVQLQLGKDSQGLAYQWEF